MRKSASGFFYEAKDKRDHSTILKSSSVSHLRNLAAISNDVEDLGIPGVSADQAGDVTGLSGRVRLQRAEYNTIGRLARGTWMDIQRQNVQAYEYLCRVGEAKEWIEYCIGDEIPGIIRLEESLRNGITLARVAKVFAPELVPRIFTAPKLQFRHSDNINRFFRFTEKVQLPEFFAFELTDLYEKRNIPKVIYSIHALSLLLSQQGLAKGIGNLSGKLEFTEDELRRTQKDLDATGLAFPNFQNITNTLETDIQVRHQSPTESIESIFDKDTASIITLQAASRGKAFRISLTQKLDLFTECSDVEQIPARARGMLLRRYHDSRIQQYDDMKKVDVVAIQSGIRARSIRKKVMADQKKILCHEVIVLFCQSRIRGQLTRKLLHDVHCTLSKDEEKIAQLQSSIRGGASRAQFQQKGNRYAQEDQFVSSFQSHLRGRHSRLQYHATRADLLNSTQHVVSLQTACRRGLVIGNLEGSKVELLVCMPAIVRLQSHIRGLFCRALLEALQEVLKRSLQSLRSLQVRCRGFIVRKDIQSCTTSMVAGEEQILSLQSVARGFLIRKLVHIKMKHFKQNLLKIVKIQSFVRAKQQGQAYKSLTSGKNLPVGTVKNFLHLLNDNNFDFEGEVELERLRKEVVQRLRANELAEQYISQLDIKIALLVRNKISLDEVLKSSGANANKMNTLLRNPTRSDPFDLKALNKASRRKLELYQTMFFILQTKPVYLARLFRSLRERGLLEKVTKTVEAVVYSLYDYAQKRREEFLFLKLITASITEELSNTPSMHVFLRSNYMYIKLLNQYHHGAKEKQFFRVFLGPIVRMVVEDDAADLDTDPLVIYRNLVNGEELSTGKRSSRPILTTSNEALRDDEVNHIYMDRIKDLEGIAHAFLGLIDDWVEKISYGIRYMAREMRRAFSLRSQGESDTNAYNLLGYLFYYRYINPAFTDPSSFSVVDGSLTPRQKKNLSEVSKLMTQVFSGVPFDDNDVFLMPLNGFIEESVKRLNSIFTILVDVENAEDFFEMTEFEDFASTSKPVLYIKTTEIFTIHGLLDQELDAITIDENDQLRNVVKELGPLSEAEDELWNVSRSEVVLTLTPRLDNTKGRESGTESLLMETKRWILYILRVQSGADLLQILICPITEQDEMEWDSVVSEDNVSQQGNVSSQELASLPYSEVKRRALENILRLEKLGVVSRKNRYQDLLNSIASDIRTKHRRRLQRLHDLENLNATIVQLEEKARFLDSQLQSFNDYIEQAMQTLQTRKGYLITSTELTYRKRKSIIPFSRQYFHQRELLKNGRVPKFGSFKYTATNLISKGVIVSIDGYGERQYEHIFFTISSDAVGSFEIEAQYNSIQIPGATAGLLLEDILQAQCEILLP